MEENEEIVEETIVDNDETVGDIQTEQEENLTEEQQEQAEEVEGVEPNMVIDVLQKGYTYKDKVIRYAMVKVSK